MNASSPATKSQSSIWVLLALGVAVGWACLETYRLWVATQQVAASQQQELRVSAKLDATRIKHTQFANADPSTRPANTSPK